MRVRYAGTVLLLAALITAGSPSATRAARKCSARTDPRTGAIEVKATGITGSPRWSAVPGGAMTAFADERTCLRRGRLKNCHLGAPDTLALVTPPANCQLCVSDGGAASCCGFVRGCTPGLRVQDPSFPSGDPRFGGGGLTGIWQRSSGSLFADQTSSQPEFLVLNADGTGNLNLREPNTGVLTCGGLFHSTSEAALVLDLSQFGFGTPVLLTSQPDGSTLALREVGGDSATFTRAAAAGAQCSAFTVNARFDGLSVVPDGFSGLAFDGASLWYEEDNTGMVFPIDPATGVLGTPVDLGSSSQFTHVHAMQGTDFWAHCGCGGSQDAQRRTMAGATVDSVDTETDLADRIGIRGIAYDGVGNVLFLHGRSANTGVQRLLRVNSNAEPDVLLGAVDFPVPLRSMTWDGANLWAIVSFSPPVVIRVDVNTATATATYAVPDATVEWQGIAAVGSHLFLVGRKSDKGVLINVSP
jgi:hypothetical protein